MIDIVIGILLTLAVIHLTLGVALKPTGNALASLFLFKFVPISTGLFLGWLGFHLMYFHP